MNNMRLIRIEKITLNVGSGKDQNVLEKGMQLIKHLTGLAPVKTITSKRIPGWGIRPGLPVGCKLTIRNGQKSDLIKRFLGAKDNVLTLNNFDDRGNISFGVHEYIDMADTEYNPDIGIMGLQISITLERPGYRVKKRKIQRSKPSRHHVVRREEAINFLKENFNIQIQEEIPEEE
jgi:large subunit ribosomal protein L5